MALTREQILQADDMRTVDVEVPEWGGTVRLRTMTAKERQAFQAAITPTKGKVSESFMERLAVATICDDAGNQLFTDADVGALSKKSSMALERIFTAAAELNGMTDKSVEQIKGE